MNDDGNCHNMLVNYIDDGDNDDNDQMTKILRITSYSFSLSLIEASLTFHDNCNDDDDDTNDGENDINDDDDDNDDNNDDFTMLSGMSIKFSTSPPLSLLRSSSL